jgi:hypothetical protein
LFNEVILAMQKTKASSADIGTEFYTLKANVRERQDNKFIPQGAKKYIIVLEGKISVLR